MKVHNLLGVALLIATKVFAFSSGVGSTGGGFAAVCRDSTGRISQVMLLDLYEASVNQGQQLINSSGNLIEDFSRANALYAQRYRMPTPSTKEQQSIFDSLMDSVVFVNPPDTLLSIDDLGGDVVLNGNCALEQIAIYLDAERLLYVRQEIWDQMDSLNQAALLQHEMLYFQFRQNGEKDSKRVRRIVGNLFTVPKS